MTREEAIYYAKPFVEKSDIKEKIPELYEALSMAIEALSAEPCDCISRKHLEEKIKVASEMSADGTTHDFKLGVSAVLLLIKAEPSVQPKPMQVDLEGDGYSDGQLVYDYGKCPKCGWDFEYGDKDWEEPYCCHCGQKLHWFESEDKE